MEILHDITLKIDERFVAVTGPNGGGKSTLAKVIAGIYQPTKGSILLDGVDITNMSITDRVSSLSALMMLNILMRYILRTTLISQYFQYYRLRL